MSNQSFHTFSRHMRGSRPMGKSAMLSAEEEKTLVAVMKGLVKGTRAERKTAREKLIMSYLPLAKRMAHNASIRGIVPRDDLESEAIMALTVAIDKFDPERGTRISTPASIEIKSALMRYVMDNSGPTRLGTNFDDKKVFMRLRSMINAIERRTNQPVQDSDLEQIANDLGVKLTAVQRMMPRIFTSDTSVAGTDSTGEDDEGGSIMRTNGHQIAVKGGQEDRDVAMDVSRIFRLMEEQVAQKWSGRNHEIILAHLRGESSTENLNTLAEKYDISVERVRQIWREGREDLRVFLQVNESIESVDDISL